jgi:hypothetical protein
MGTPLLAAGTVILAAGTVGMVTLATRMEDMTELGMQETDTMKRVWSVPSRAGDPP